VLADLLVVRGCPAEQRAGDFQEAGPERGKGVLDTGRYLRIGARSFRDAWRGPVVYRDLAAVPVPHITAAGITARFAGPAGRSPEQAAAAEIQDELIGEFLGAAFAGLLPRHQASLADSHEQARKLAEAFQATG